MTDGVKGEGTKKAVAEPDIVVAKKSTKVDGRTFNQEEVDRIVQKRIGERDQQHTADLEAVKTEAKANVETAVADLKAGFSKALGVTPEEATPEAVAAAEKANSADLEAQVIRAQFVAAAAGKVANPGTVFDMLDTSKLTLDRTSMTVPGMEDLVTAISGLNPAAKPAAGGVEPGAVQGAIPTSGLAGQIQTAEGEPMTEENLGNAQFVRENVNAIAGQLAKLLP